MLLVLVAIGPTAARADELAYSCGDNLCTIDPDHPETHAQLTELQSSSRAAPAWSPDGTRIAFTANRENQTYSDLYVIAPADPTTVTDISNTLNEIDFEGNWSADGTELAWESDNPAPPTGSPTNDISFAPSSGESVVQKIEPTSLEERRPVWSPTGARLAYGRANYVYLASPLESLSAQPLLKGLGFNPEWSPDGTKIASVSAEESGSVPTGAIRITDADGSGVYSEMPVKGLFYSTVSWSPDSAHITYVDEHDEVRVAPTDPAAGSGFTIPLGSGIRVPHEPVWSPDGTQIAFAAEDIALGYDEIYVAPATGGEPVLVTKTATTNIEPTWRPEPGVGTGGGSGGGSSGGGSGGSTGSGSGGSSGSGSSGSSGGGSSSSSGGGTTPPATHKPVVLSVAAFRHPYVRSGALGGAYVPCNLGPSSNPVCHASGEATFVSPITHSLDRSRSTKKKPTVFAKGSVTVPNGKTEPLLLKLTGAGKKLLRPGKTLKLTVTVVETAPDATPETTTRKIAVKLPKKG